MNLHHILGTARKLGIPVVITNERGESPQVVMPFEDFASMVGVQVAKEQSTHKKEHVAPKNAPASFVDEASFQGTENVTVEANEPIANELREDERIQVPEQERDILEDEFYFESIEGKE